MTKQDETREQAEFAIVKMLKDESWYASLHGSHLKAIQILNYLEGAGWRAPKGKREEKQNQAD